MIYFEISDLNLIVGEEREVLVTDDSGTSYITTITSSNSSVVSASGTTGEFNSVLLLTGISKSSAPVIITVTNSNEESATLPVNVFGIDVTYVGNKLGFYSANIGELCMASSYINKWSTMKPMVSTVLELTPAIVHSLKSGLDIPAVSFADYKTAVFSESFSQYTWDYIPVTETDLKRIGDFRGYSPNAISMLVIPSFSTIGVGLGSTAESTFDCTQNYQVPGGLVPSDIMSGSGYHLGVAFINVDTQTTNIIVANPANLEASQTVTIDLINLITGTYYACLFIGSTGFAQIEDPTDSQLTAIGTIYPLEGGVLTIAINNANDLPTSIWSFIGTGMIKSGFESSDFYTLYVTSSPTISTTSMIWNSYTNLFYLNPIWDPSQNVEWELSFAMYIDNANWVADSYRSIVYWDDVDSTTQGLFLKTNSSGIITIAFGTSDTSFIQTVTTSVTMSSSSSSPTILTLSNRNASNQNYFTVSLNGTATALSSNECTTFENPPILYFGYKLDFGSAPRGLGYMYIDLVATETYT